MNKFKVGDMTVLKRREDINGNNINIIIEFEERVYYVVYWFVNGYLSVVSSQTFEKFYKLKKGINKI